MLFYGITTYTIKTARRRIAAGGAVYIKIYRLKMPAVFDLHGYVLKQKMPAAILRRAVFT